MATITMSTEMKNLSRMIDFILTRAKKIEFCKKQLYNLTLASEEILVNIISYACPGKKGAVRICCSKKY